jgi:hypothetical protein
LWGHGYGTGLLEFGPLIGYDLTEAPTDLTWAFPFGANLGTSLGTSSDPGTLAMSITKGPDGHPVSMLTGASSEHEGENPFDFQVDVEGGFHVQFDAYIGQPLLLGLGVNFVGTAWGQEGGSSNIDFDVHMDQPTFIFPGDVTLYPIRGGDFDGDGDVDHADLVHWKSDFGLNANSDADGDGDSDGTDFLDWQRQLGSSLSVASAVESVPEPGALALASLVGCGLAMLRQRHR